jgi:hypothetical protein
MPITEFMNIEPQKIIHKCFQNMILDFILNETLIGPGPGIEPGSGDPQSPRISTTPPRPFFEGNRNSHNIFMLTAHL